MPKQKNVTTTVIGLYRSGLTSIDRLENTSIGRDDIVSEFIDKLKSRTNSHQHTVFIGPRGIGKTHLISLIINKVNVSQPLSKRYTVIRFPEENHRILTFADFLLGVAEILGDVTGDQDWKDLFNRLQEENEDERRLFFVAVTRARKKVFLSYSTSDFSGRDRTASQFWYEVSDDLCQTFATDQVEAELQKLLPVFIAMPDEPRLTEGEKNILREQVKRFVWSASSLQNYLDCPRKFLFQNLFRIPRRPTPPMALGTSMHAALEKFLRTFRISGKLPDDSELIAEFERSLRGQNIPTSDFQKLLEHGRDILKKYFHAKRENFSDNVELEKNFREHAPQIGGVPATGKIDKVEFLDERKTQAVLVDYKSGKPRSIRRGQREWRQLVFYDLLVRNSAGISWNVTACVLEFLTPGLSGKFERKKLEISEEDRQQVISELQEANEKIQTLQFPFIPNPEGDSEIEYWQNFGR